MDPGRHRGYYRLHAQVAAGGGGLSQAAQAAGSLAGVGDGQMRGICPKLDANKKSKSQNKTMYSVIRHHMDYFLVKLCYS